MIIRALPLLTLIGIAASGCARETVAHSQDERAANRIISLLYFAGAIEADAVKLEKANPPAFDVSVSATDHQRALAILERHNLPAEKREDTCALLMQSQVIPTPERERAKTVCGITGDITNKLRSMDRVVEASVLLSIPAKDFEMDPTEPRARPKASVIVSYLPNLKGEPPISQEEVERFAAAAVPELAVKDVFVRMVEAKNEWAVLPESKTCLKTEMMGVAICAEHRSRLASVLLIAICVSGLFAAMMLIAVLRAHRYRKELTQLSSVRPSPSAAR